MFNCVNDVKVLKGPFKSYVTHWGVKGIYH